MRISELLADSLAYHVSAASLSSSSVPLQHASCASSSCTTKCTFKIHDDTSTKAIALSPSSATDNGSNSVSTTSGWQRSLPLVLFHSIFEMVGSSRDLLLVIERVCKLWRRASRDNGCGWTRLDLWDWIHNDEDNRHAYINDTTELEHVTATLYHLLYPRVKLNQIKELRIEQWHDSISYIDYISQWPHLTSLEVLARWGAGKTVASLAHLYSSDICTNNVLVWRARIYR